jgi:hypothetical protein
MTKVKIDQLVRQPDRWISGQFVYSNGEIDWPAFIEVCVLPEIYSATLYAHSYGHKFCTTYEFVPVESIVWACGQQHLLKYANEGEGRMSLMEEIESNDDFDDVVDRARDVADVLCLYLSELAPYDHPYHVFFESQDKEFRQIWSLLKEGETPNFWSFGVNQK